MQEYAPKRCRAKTQRNYGSVFKNHIRPKWECEFIQNVKTMAVENWLDTYPHSQQVKSHVKRLMHTLFNAAIRWEMIDRNPIDLVRVSARRQKKPRVLTPVEFKALLGRLAEPYRTMVLTVACLGLRVSEVLGLQWGDINLESLTVRIQRSVVEGEVNETKTEASESALPLDPNLAETLLAHKTQAVFTAASDYVFASRTGKPRCKDTLLARYLKPAAARVGIGNIGWHTFRHTYSTLLHSLGTTPAVQKELLRHANIQTTFNVYTQAVTAEKREAATKVVGALWKM
jgi:integrase